MRDKKRKKPKNTHIVIKPKIKKSRSTIENNKRKHDLLKGAYAPHTLFEIKPGEREEINVLTPADIAEPQSECPVGNDSPYFTPPGEKKKISKSECRDFWEPLQESAAEDGTPSGVVGGTPQIPGSDDKLQEVVSEIRSEENSSDYTPEARAAWSLFWGITFFIASFLVVVVGLGLLYLIANITSNQTEPIVIEGKPPLAFQQTATTILVQAASTTTHLTSTTSTTAATVPLVVCSQPYIRFGMGCCLDGNGNRICDTDESTTTSTTMPLNFVWCSSDLDCGATRVEYTCIDGNVHKMTLTHLCRRPGLQSSYCERRVVDDLVDKCMPTEQCVKGRQSCQSNWVPNNFED